MKKLLNILIVVAGLTVGYGANTVDDLGLIVKEDNILLIQVDNVQKGDLVYFSDEVGEVLFKHKPALGDAYTTSLDLQNLPAGTYYLNIDKQYFTLTTRIEKTAGGLRIEDESPKTFFKPRFKVDEKLVKVFLTNPAETRTVIKVYDSKGTLVTTIKDKEESISKTLNFSNVPPGEYKIIVQAGRSAFSKIVQIG